MEWQRLSSIYKYSHRDLLCFFHYNFNRTEIYAPLEMFGLFENRLLIHRFFPLLKWIVHNFLHQLKICVWERQWIYGCFYLRFYCKCLSLLYIFRFLSIAINNVQFCLTKWIRFLVEQCCTQYTIYCHNENK